MRGMTETVTLWNRTRDDAARRDVWTRRVIEGCSWEADIENPSAPGPSFTVLLPPDGVAAPGDIAAKGARDAEITHAAPNTASAVLDSLKPDAFIVRAVYDGAAERKRGRHIELTGV